MVGMRRFPAALLCLVLLAQALWAVPDTPYSSDTMITYHTTLSSRQRNLVDILYAALSNMETGVEFDQAVPVADLDKAVEHVLSDYPELFHVGREYWYLYHRGEEDMITGIEFTYTVTADEWIDMLVEALEVASSMMEGVRSGMTDYDAELLVHDELCGHVEYSLRGKWGYTMYGALAEGKAACEGYAEAFCLMMRMLGIPCSMVWGVGVDGDGSEDHEWNIVEISGELYLVDPTWNDTWGGMGWFNVDDGLMERDHEADPLFDWPECTSLDANWHVANGLWASRGIDTEALLRWMASEARRTGEEVSVRFESEKDLEAFLDGFDDNLQEYADETGDYGSFTVGWDEWPLIAELEAD